METRELILGIDLGTTTSCVAAVVDGKARVIADREGNRVFPSVVAFTTKGEFVGAPARRFLITDPENTVHSFKRLLGRKLRDPVSRVAVAGSSVRLIEGPGGAAVIRTRAGDFSIPEIAAKLLRMLVEVASRALRSDLSSAVIAVPASFDLEQRNAVKIAGRIAGLEKVQLIEEPTAAALAFGCAQRTERTLCIYDFGGGTLDVTILEMCGRDLRRLAAAGEPMLGGDDLDVALAFAAAESFRVQTGKNLWRDAAEWQRLLFACEEAKRRLSYEPTAEIRLRAVARIPSGPKDLVFSVDRRKFQQICGEKIEQTLQCCAAALGQAQREPGDIDTVLLVGGSTQVRLVRSRVAQFFRRNPDVSVDPIEAVAVGAAIHGAQWVGLPVVELALPRLLQVSPEAIALRVGRCLSVVFSRFEPIPAVERREITIAEDGGPENLLEVVVEREDGTWRRIGEIDLGDLLMGRATVFWATLGLDEGRVSVEVTDPRTGRGSSREFPL